MELALRRKSWFKGMSLTLNWALAPSPMCLPLHSFSYCDTSAQSSCQSMRPECPVLCRPQPLHMSAKQTALLCNVPSRAYFAAAMETVTILDVVEAL